MKKKRCHKQKGLTFLELLVTITIISIIALIISVNYPTIRKELALQRAAHKIAQDLRRTETSAMSAQCSSCQIIFDMSEKTSYQVLEKTVNLEKGVELKSLSPASPLTISFSPPNPTTSINGLGSGSEAVITITNSIRNKIIKINNVGRIEIE